MVVKTLRTLRNVRDEIYFCYIYFLKKVHSEVYIAYVLPPVRYFFWYNCLNYLTFPKFDIAS